MQESEIGLYLAEQMQHIRLHFEFRRLQSRVWKFRMLSSRNLSVEDFLQGQMI
jgi:hypothetical protein